VALPKYSGTWRLGFPFLFRYFQDTNVFNDFVYSRRSYAKIAVPHRTLSPKPIFAPSVQLRHQSGEPKAFTRKTWLGKSRSGIQLPLSAKLE